MAAMKRSAIASLSMVVSTLAIGGAAFLSWAEPFKGRLWPMSPYAISPLFDMLASAFACLVVYMLAVRSVSPEPKQPRPWLLRLLTILFICVLLLHPGTLFWQLWRDGYGLPPLSYMHFYTPDQQWPIVIGTLGYGLVFGVALVTIKRARMPGKALTGTLLIGIISMYVYALLANVFIVEWYRPIFIGYGAAAALALLLMGVRWRRIGY